MRTTEKQERRITIMNIGRLCGFATLGIGISMATTDTIPFAIFGIIFIVLGAWLLSSKESL